MQKGPIWDNSLLPRFPELAGDAECDVLVIGGGLCGLLCAHYLTMAGMNVLLMEADRVASATTVRSTAVVSVGQDVLYRDIANRMGTDTARQVIGARMGALKEYLSLTRELGARCSVTDFSLFSTDGEKRLEREYDALCRMGIDCRFSPHLPSGLPSTSALTFPGQMLLDPADFTSRLARGLTIRENARAVRLTSYGAMTDKYRITADKVIIATHFPFPRLKGLFALKLYQQRSYVLALDGAPLVGACEDITEGGVYMRMYGTKLLLGGGDHRTGTKGGGFAPVLEYRSKNFAGSRIDTAWATQDTVSLDGLPYIGRLTGTNSKFYVAAGFGGNGFMGSMMSALILRDTITGRPSPYAKVFSPQRSMLTLQLAKNIAHTIGTYFIPTARRCPHLGCALVWNPDERSWDCPCHGSRFDQNGNLINGPSQRDLS